MLAGAVATATAGSPNEENLRAEIEKALEKACRSLGLPWVPYQLDRTLRGGANGKKVRFADVAHGAVVIEYEPPKSFRGGRARAALTHAYCQAEEYAELLSEEEGRPLPEYICVVWDGNHICFGRYDGAGFNWEAPEPFNAKVAQRLLGHIRDDGAALVHPLLLAQLVGPESTLGASLLPKLHAAVRATRRTKGRTTKTGLLFTEWRRLFGQVVGVQTDRLKDLLEAQGQAHGMPYDEDPAAYLFALNTYIALVAKLVAAMALPNPSQDIRDPRSPLADRIDALESGQIFANAGIVNMLNGDFFAWYRDDDSWSDYEPDIKDLVETLRAINFDVSRKAPESTRDLFKGLYMRFVPSALRHALGEYYTPDWLAAHALDVVKWPVEAALGDPTCGTGTFVLEGLKRRLAASPSAPAGQLLRGLWGLDLNPLAVLAARASLVVFLSDKLRADDPLRLPIFLADAINPASACGGAYHHTLQTERGERSFRVPVRLVEDKRFFEVFGRVRELVDANYDTEGIFPALDSEFDLAYLCDEEREHLRSSLDTLVALHEDQWDGIWCVVLAERFAAGAIPASRFVVGNPPWVKWSHLPPEYADFIKDRCLELGVFSVDRWVGGIESDISTVITYEAVDKYVVDDGTLAFFITGTVFANESSQGFRRWRLDASGVEMKVRLVEDYSTVAPFEGVSNHATLLVVTKGKATNYPVDYRVWVPPRDPRNPRLAKRTFADAAVFRGEASHVDLEARPVPGTDAGPWLKGTAAQHDVWSHLFGQQVPAYRARKGVTTDANGIFFVKVRDAGSDEIEVENDPTLGRKALRKIKRKIEKDHVFPLLRGEGVTPFKAFPDATYRIVVPQREMHGDQDLPRTARKTHQWLLGFRSVLEKRSSFRRFQERAGAPWWSLWSTGPYTFSQYKVAWREMGGGRFAAAYVAPYSDPLLGTKTVVPDHKVYFVSCDTSEEAAYLTGFLNAPVVAEAVSAYAAQLSLGVSVVEYLLIPQFDRADDAHKKLAAVATGIMKAASFSEEDSEKLDNLAATIMRIPAKVLRDVRRDAAAPEVQAAEAAVTA